MLIFDIGANRGKYTDAQLMVMPDVKVVCVEANPKYASLLKAKFADNANITVVPKAVSAIKGDIRFFIYDNEISSATQSVMENTRFSSDKVKCTEISVQTISIDELIALYGNPDLIKVDVENYEDVAIASLTTKQQALCFEWMEENLEPTINTVKHLQSLGYEKFGFMMEDNYLYQPEIRMTADQLLAALPVEAGRKQTWGMIWTE